MTMMTRNKVFFLKVLAIISLILVPLGSHCQQILHQKANAFEEEDEGVRQLVIPTVVNARRASSTATKLDEDGSLLRRGKRRRRILQGAAGRSSGGGGRGRSGGGSSSSSYRRGSSNRTARSNNVRHNNDPPLFVKYMIFGAFGIVIGCVSAQNCLTTRRRNLLRSFNLDWVLNGSRETESEIGIVQDDTQDNQGTHLKFPSGNWRGYYQQYDQDHYLKEFNLYEMGPPFSTHTAVVLNLKGNGTDNVGDYTIDGLFCQQSGRVTFTKYYVRGTGSHPNENKGHSVEYRGEMRRRSGTSDGSGSGNLTFEIRGTWDIITNDYVGNGPFHLWPANLHTYEQSSTTMSSSHLIQRSGRKIIPQQ